MRLLLITSLLAIMSLLVSGKKAESTNGQKPNVVIVMTDDQGYGDLACHGNPLIKTPNIDDFYNESVRFTNFHVGSTCSPTRSMLMTGRYCNRVGVWHTVMGRSLLDSEEMTIAEIFKMAGYKTGMFGKWHLGDNYPFRPQDRGFDEVITHGGGAIGNIQDYWGNDYFDDTYLKNGELVKFQGYCTEIWFNEAIKFIETNKDHPFFCYIPTNAAHGPFLVPDKYKEMYDPSLGDEEKERQLSGFYGMITNIDENFGRLINRLRELGIEKNTILVFLSDNGSANSFYFNAGMRAEKGSEYDGGHRVPFFIRYPRATMGRGIDIDKLAGAVDILPSLLDLCGIESPDVSFDGKSLVPLLVEKDPDWPDRIMYADRQRIEYPMKWYRTSVMKGPWRLVNEYELYNVSMDPGQVNDISDKYPEILSELSRAYDEYWESLKPALEKTPHFILGNELENPTWLSVHDVHGEHRFLQEHVSNRSRADGYWAVEVEQEGNYQVVLRTWPPYLKGKKIYENLCFETPDASEMVPNAIVGATYARLKIFDIDIDKEFDHNAEEVVFEVLLGKGKTRLQAWFVNGNRGGTCGPYYIGVKRLE